MATTAEAAGRTVSCTYAAVAAALSNATPGSTVKVHSGTINLTSEQTITITKGVTLLADHKVTLNKAAGTVNQPIISVALASPAKVTIEGFNLRNSGVTTTSATGSNSAAVGINIVGDGVAELNPSIIRNNSFTGFTDAAIVLSTNGGPQEHWLVENNTFTNVFYGLFLNGANDLLLLNNEFVSYLAAVTNTDDTSPITLLRVTLNSFLGGMPTMSGVGNDHGTGTAGTRALNLHMNAVTPGADLNWKINKNLFNQHTGMALRFKAAAEGANESTSAVYVQMNSFTGNTADMVNEASTDVELRLNWWGTVCGPTETSLNGQAVDDLWLVTYSVSRRRSEHGFRLGEISSTEPGMTSSACD
jgi:hypothetical protein